MAFEPYTEGTSEPPAVRGLVLLTVQREGDLAGAWHEALLATDIDAELHIRDAASFSPTSSVYPTGAPFVYALFVAQADRERAANLLIDLGWDGRGIGGTGRRRGGRASAGGALRNAVLVAGASLALVMALIALRGA